jgi:hypothetical protein
MMMPDGIVHDSPIRPVIRTFYDHMQVVSNDFNFFNIFVLTIFLWCL